MLLLDARSVNSTHWNEKGTSLDAGQLSLSFSLARIFLTLLGFSCRGLGISRKGRSRTNAVSSRL